MYNSNSKMYNNVKKMYNNVYLCVTFFTFYEYCCFCWFFESYCAMQSEKLSKSVKIKFVIAYLLHHKTIIAKPLHFMLFQSWIFRLKNLRFEGGSLSSPANCQWYRDYLKFSSLRSGFNERFNDYSQALGISFKAAQWAAIV